jgi:hypothetical protein
MIDKLDLNEIKKRASYAAFQDGLMEIFMGLFLVFFGGALSTSVGTGFPLIVIAIFFANPLIERIKVRYIYPRVGYVKLPPDPSTTGKGIAMTAALFVVLLLGSMGISMGVLGRDEGMGFFMTYILPPASGFMLGIGPFWLGQTYGLVRGYLLSAFFLLSGIAMPVFNIATGYEAVGLMCSLVGLVALVVGTFMFVRFLRKYPAAPDGVELLVDEG